jgi:hypothetical protein
VNHEVFTLEPQAGATDARKARRQALRDQADRPEGDSRPADRRGADHGARRAAGALRPAPGGDGRDAATCKCASSLHRSPSSRVSTTSNHGGSEFVVYRVTPADAASGVRVGDKEYPGFPGKGRGDYERSGGARRVLRAALRPGPRHADAGLRARRGRQRGRDAARQPHLSRSPIRRAAIEIDDKFLGRVVPAITGNYAGDADSVRRPARGIPENQR